MEFVYIGNFLFCLMHVNFLTRGGMSPWLTGVNWFGLVMNSLVVILQLVI